MVTFRFYLVSIVAFFLALAVGVVIGSVLDEGISNSLKDRLERVEGNLDETVSVIDQKNRHLKELENYASESEPYVVEGRLDGTSTLVVAEAGVDQDAVEELVDGLRGAGSNTPGIVWVDKSWDMKSERFLRRLAEVVNDSGLDSEDLDDRIWTDVLLQIQVANARSSGPTPESSTTVPDESTPPTTSPSTTEDTTGDKDHPEPVKLFASALLVQMAQNSLVSLQTVDGDNPVGGPALNVVAVTSNDSKLAVPGSSTAALVSASAPADIPTVMGEHFDVSEKSDTKDQSAPSRGALLDSSINADLRSIISTVDNLDMVAGRVATILALSQFDEGAMGDYGFGPDVDSILPASPRP